MQAPHKRGDPMDSWMVKGRPATTETIATKHRQRQSRLDGSVDPASCPINSRWCRGGNRKWEGGRQMQSPISRNRPPLKPTLS